MNPQAALVRATRGPVVLIILGALLAIHRFGDFSITKTWPVLLIAVGAMKLLERALNRVPAEPLAPPPGAPGMGGFQS